MHAFSRSLARAVKNARDKMNLTQEQVGELVDTNTRTISSIENAMILSFHKNIPCHISRGCPENWNCSTELSLLFGVYR